MEKWKLSSQASSVPVGSWLTVSSVEIPYITLLISSTKIHTYVMTSYRYKNGMFIFVIVLLNKYIHNSKNHHGDAIFRISVKIHTTFIFNI